MSSNEIEKAGIEMVRPLLLDWQVDHETIIDTSHAKSAAIWQRTLGDFIILSDETNEYIGIEVKSEEKWTGNFFAETYSNAAPGEFHRYGWLITLKCDRILNVFLDLEIAISMEFKRLQQWCFAQNNIKRYPPRIPHKIQQNITIGHIIPFSHLIPAVGAMVWKRHMGMWHISTLDDTLSSTNVVSNSR